MPLPATFLRSLLIALFLGLTGVGAQPVISEFVASNRAGLADSDGAYSDWIEIHNPGTDDLDLTGWYLTDATTNRTKWQFPAVTLPAGAYLVVFASNKDRRDPSGELHTNFALSAGGEYLGLIRPDGTTVAFEYAPQFPAQTDDVSYGLPVLDTGAFGAPVFMRTPTPGRANAKPDPAAPAVKVGFSRAPGPFLEGFSLQLTGASPGQVIRYEVHAPTVNGDFPPELGTDSPVYSAPLTIDRSVIVRAAVFAADSSARGDISTAYYALLAPSAAEFSGKLPVIVIDSLATGPLDKDAVDHPSWMYVYGARPDSTSPLKGNPELVTALTSTVRGSSSSFFPKKGYNLKLTDDNGRRQAKAVLGLPAHERWAVVAPWSFDPAFLNNAYVYALSNRMGRWAPRTRFAELFFNADGGPVEASDYAGIFVLTDRAEVGPARIAIASMSPTDEEEPALTGGYIFKLDAPDWDEFAWTTERGIPKEQFTAIVLVAPKIDEITTLQRGYLIDYVQQMENALFADRDTGFAQRTYLDYIDRASWVDHHILNTFAGNPDALERSAFFTKPRQGKLQAGPVWDFDRALGSVAEGDGRSFRWDVWSGAGASDVWNTGWWGVLARDPEFMQEWVDRWQSLRKTTLADSALTELVSSLATEIGPEAAARDAARWPEKAIPHGDFLAEVDHVKTWVGQRARWIDRQLCAPPEVRLEGTNLVFTAPAGGQLVYTTDGSDPRSLGGGFAPTAIVATGSVSVATTLNVQVRHYREDLKNTFPGSPWSSAVGGTSSSPLRPASRIANLSVRAQVGAGEQALIIGVSIADTNAKRYLARAVGPGLGAFGVEGMLPDPELILVSAAGTELARNSAWEESPDAALIPDLAKSVGAFSLATGSRDAALVRRMAAGSFSLHAGSATDLTGSSLVELYELDSNGRTLNLSTRAQVDSQGRTLTGGFVVQGSAYKRLLIRAIGPTLTSLGVANALADPVLKVFAGKNEIAANDRWETATNATMLRAATRQTGAFELTPGSEDAALLMTLPPGAYTLEVTAKGDAEGVVLLEIYEVP